MSATKNIYIISASQDNKVLQNLLLHLQPLEKDFSLVTWCDDAIQSGQPWKPKNVSRLDQADIFLLLVSHSFMYSEFIKQDEFKMVIDRYKEGSSTVIPILLDECPWNIEFTSDDYNFSFKELQVFPNNKKPIGDSNSTDTAFKQVANHVRGLLTPSIEKIASEEISNIEAKELLKTKEEEQIAIDFFEEMEARKKAEREKIHKEEAEVKERIEEKKVLSENVEARKANKIEKRLRQKAEIQKRIEKEKELKEQAKKDKKIIEEAEARRVAEEKRAYEDEKTRKEEAQQRSNALAKAKREAERNKILEGVAVPQKIKKKNGFAGQNYQFKSAAEIKKNTRETLKIKDKNGKRKFHPAFLAVGILILGILGYYTFRTDTPIQSTISSENETSEINSDGESIVENSSSNDAGAILKLEVGDSYGGGIIFEIDETNRAGKIVHIDDAGPMPWNDAMKIHEQLGEEWRLPTFDELERMYQAIGPGANNRAEFAAKLYWSSTPFDEYQARLLKFSNGNATYHYNKENADRKFLVRAVQNFSR